MRKIITSIFIVILLIVNTNAQDHQLFTGILKDYVKNGLVDYENLRKDERLPKYLNQLSGTNIEKLTRNEKLAFWINAYNAFTLFIINKNYPVKSITDLHTGGRIIGYLLGKTIWDKEFIEINGSKFSLNDIEHKILRKMNEPRIHFAIVCASISCPEIRDEAYVANKLETQLEKQATKFINDPSRNKFDLKNREAEISEIFNWFEEDFGNDEEEVLLYIAKYLPEEITNDIINNLTEWDVSYMNYNWGLNEYVKND